MFKIITCSNIYWFDALNYLCTQDKCNIKVKVVRNKTIVQEAISMSLSSNGRVVVVGATVV